MPDVATPTAIPSAGTKVTGGIDPARLARALGPLMTKALDKLGEKEVASVQQDLSTPVVVTVGPDGGQHIERSKRGDPPRMDQGVLVQNVKHEVIPGDGAVPLPTLRIESSRPGTPEAPSVLEFELDRPILGPALVRLQKYAKDFISQALSGQ